MKNKLFLILLLLDSFFNFGQNQKPLALAYNEINKQIIIIESTSDYQLSQRLLSEKNSDTKCLVFNIISNNHNKSAVAMGAILVVIKIFIEGSPEKALIEINPDTLKNSFNIKSLILKAKESVSSQLLLNISNMIQKGDEESTISNFTTVWKKGGKYYKIKGEALCQFFNLLDFVQNTLLQSNLTIINRLSIIDSTKYYLINDGTDSLATYPLSLLENRSVDLQGKIFLAKKNTDGSYKFYRRHISCMDCTSRSIEEFDYLPGVGIISFLSKIPVWRPLGELSDSEKYYRFIEK